MRNSVILLMFCGSIFASGCGKSSGPSVSANPETATAIRESLEQLVGTGGDANNTVPAAEPTGFATLSGRFIFEGAIPTVDEVNIQKDPQICKPGGKPVFNEVLQVNPQNQGIKNVLIFVSSKVPSGDSKWEHPDYAATANSTLSGLQAFDQKACRFLSHVYALRTGQTLEVLNSDPVGHNVNIQPSSSKVQSLNITVPANGGKVMYKAGGESKTPVTVSCSIHPWMRAYILPRENPFFAVSDDDGNFSIPNVPTGVELEFRIWQEKAKFLSGPVKLNAASQTLKRGRIKVTLQPKQDLQWDFSLGAPLFK